MFIRKRRLREVRRAFQFKAAANDVQEHIARGRHATVAVDRKCAGKCVFTRQGDVGTVHNRKTAGPGNDIVEFAIST